MKVLLQAGITQFGEQKIPVGEITRLAIEGRGRLKKLPTLVVYFFAPDVEEWGIARFTAAWIDETNSVQSGSGGCEKAGGRVVVGVNRFSD